MSSWWSFGAVKKEQTSPTPTTNHASPTQPFKTMSTAFRRGVQYNMKIVIRGDVMTGKSTLFNRLQGSEFEEETYQSTPQIQVANIPWHYKDSNDIVKIEVWDVVDKAHNNNTKKDTGIKLEHASTSNTTTSTTTDQATSTPSPSTDLALDASTVDVYRNAHAALFIFDITKQWTFDYVNKALDSVPENVAVLVLGNFMDKERVVSVDEIHATLYEHNKRRIEKGTIKPNLIRYVEISLKTGLGLKFIYDYLGVPFLQLMMETLRKQLELKATDILDLLETLDKDDDVPEHMQRRRGQDNFDQPSEPHLARQHDAMKMAWDEELQEIAADHEPTAIDNELGHERSNPTPPPPTAPVKMKKRHGSLVSPDIQPPAVDQFDAGSIEDDWFGDDSVTQSTTMQIPQQQDQDNKNENDDDDDDNIPGNPMVTRDEDVASVEYYQEKQQEQQIKSTTTHTSISPLAQQRRSSQESTTVMVMVPEEDIDDEDTNDGSNDNRNNLGGMMAYHMYQSPVFKSELNDVWAAHGTIGGSMKTSGGGGINVIQSDSEDEDNMIRQPMNTTPSDFDDYQHRFDSSSSFTGIDGSGGYEEIGGASHDNPWSQPTYENFDANDKDPIRYVEQQEEMTDYGAPADVPDKTSSTDKKAKKKKKKKSKSAKISTKS
ncbi:uncharacterized protein BX664DRAFT_328970 [Halteromyces radiatus]|uniref:uncharacterized protein n=1 Tax=Halteromyces radiatus TaxID=101107 RepID=UPI00221FE18C|nr:uncharacterized protein BX664DRAFT_328970 [Halteromyces radiatus]KAI8093120.1 hypothetical protein BX664DRAFT_328970 [Halteromyces radiatus]